MDCTVFILLGTTAKTSDKDKVFLKKALPEKQISYDLNQSFLIIDKIITNDTEMPVLLPMLVIQNQPGILQETSRDSFSFHKH